MKPIAYIHTGPNGRKDLDFQSLTHADKAHGWTETSLVAVPKIKLLVWQGQPDNPFAVCMLGIYWYDAGKMMRNGPKVIGVEHHFGVWDVYKGSDIDAAKEAAQKDFEAIVLATLE